MECHDPIAAKLTKEFGSLEMGLFQTRYLVACPWSWLTYPTISVARLGDLLDFGQVFGEFAQISHILRQFL